mgnify:CR=1 FL=1
MAWRNSKATAKLLAQVNALAPGRDKSWDGTIGDTAHSKRKSDHNPNAAGVVCAIDITHDPKHGVDGEVLANALRTSGDQRINYVIFNKRIAGAGKGWNWRKYTGAPHDHHVHLSVKQDPALYDSGVAWKLVLLTDFVAPKPVPKPELLPKPAVGERTLTEAEVREMQDTLRALDFTTVGETDGVVGPMLKGALTQYCEVNGIAYRDPPTIALLWHMQSPAAKRAVPSDVRRDASPKKVEDIAPEAKTAKDSGWWATVDAGIKAFAAGASVYIASAAQTIVDNKETILVYGGWAVALVIAGSIAVSYYQKRKAASIVRTVTAAVQDGDRFRSAGQ